MPPDRERVEAAIAGAERFLNAWRGRPGPRERLLAVAEATGKDERLDTYGKGERIERLEARVAELLGEEAAVFMPSGTMAQQIALRIWSERRGTRTVAFHPTWQRRHGGNLVTQHPFVVAAETALETRLERMPVYAEHARALAVELGTVDGLEVVPDPPQTPMFHLHLRGDAERLADAALAVAEERKVFLFAEPSPTSSPRWQRHEVMVGETTLALEPGEVRELYAEVLERASAPATAVTAPRKRPRARR